MARKLRIANSVFFGPNLKTAMRTITQPNEIPLDLRWNTIVALVKRMIHHRTSPDLFFAVLQTDLHGNLILTHEKINRLAVGMSIQDAVSIVGCEPYRNVHPQQLVWYTMCGVILSVGIDHAKDCITGASLIGDPLPFPAYSVQLSSKDIVTFFFLHSNREQRQWLLSILEDLPLLEITDTQYSHYHVRQVSNHVEPTLHGAERFDAKLDPLINDKDFEKGFIEAYGRSRLEYHFNGRVPEPFGIRNSLSDSDADKLWKRVLAVWSTDKYREYMNAASVLRHFPKACPKRELQEMIEFVNAGKYGRAVTIAKAVRERIREDEMSSLLAEIRAFEATGTLTGRQYKAKKHSHIWQCYVSVLHYRDNSCCQYCGWTQCEVESKSMHVDHILPLKLGGKTELSNLQLLCGDCNAWKETMRESEFGADVRAMWFKNSKRKLSLNERKFMRNYCSDFDKFSLDDL